jgi:hypothetical protein
LLSLGLSSARRWSPATALAPVEGKVATQIAIDTERRPEDILDLPAGSLGLLTSTTGLDIGS